jgi:hypothetical protein
LGRRGLSRQEIIKELYNLCSSANIIRMIRLSKMKWTKHVMNAGEEECLWNFGGKARSKETTRKNRYRWEDNTILNIR